MLHYCVCLFPNADDKLSENLDLDAALKDALPDTNTQWGVMGCSPAWKSGQNGLQEALR